MLNLTQEQIAEITESMRQENGANAEEVANILKRVLTVGDLKKALANVDDSLPVELEIVLEISDDGDCAAQPGLAIHHYQIRKGDDGYPRFTIVGAQPQNSEAYAEAFELDILKQ
ncbi:MAG: hypothetical protein H7256_09130 [Bdellovibrio sp.]|nr:hypothetical protein [Bdellovibrio sp.]